MSTIKVNSIEPANAGSEDYFLARAWINLNGTGTVAIRADGNVSSITDQGVGQYAVTFQNSFADVNYATTATRSGSASGSYVAGGNAGYAPTSSAYYIGITYPGVGNADDSIVAADFNR